MKNFLSVGDVTNLDQLVDKALEYKTSPLKDRTLGKDKTMGMLFLNPSMRTRLSTQLAAKNLGMESIVFRSGIQNEPAERSYPWQRQAHGHVVPQSKYAYKVEYTTGREKSRYGVHCIQIGNTKRAR